jgi:hypothetical protein
MLLGHLPAPVTKARWKQSEQQSTCPPARRLSSENPMLAPRFERPKWLIWSTTSAARSLSLWSEVKAVR